MRWSENVKSRFTRRSLLPALLSVLAVVIAGRASEGGKLKAPLQVPLYMNGNAVGKATMPAGSPVVVLRTVDGKSEVETASGTNWIDANEVEITGETPAFVAQKAQEAQAEAARISASFSRPAPEISDRPTGKENIPSTWPAAEKRVLDLVNKERTSRGIPPLVWDEDLARAARYHAAHMVANRYFEHDSKTKTGPIKCITRIQMFTEKGRGENIALGQRSPEQAMDSWMRSPGHRANILRKEAKTIGVGIWGTMWVQDFGA